MRRWSLPAALLLAGVIVGTDEARACEPPPAPRLPPCASGDRYLIAPGSTIPSNLPGIIWYGEWDPNKPYPPPDVRWRSVDGETVSFSFVPIGSLNSALLRPEVELLAGVEYELASRSPCAPEGTEFQPGNSVRFWAGPAATAPSPPGSTAVTAAVRGTLFHPANGVACPEQPWDAVAVGVAFEPSELATAWAPLTDVILVVDGRRWWQSGSFSVDGQQGLTGSRILFHICETHEYWTPRDLTAGVHEAAFEISVRGSGTSFRTESVSFALDCGDAPEQPTAAPFTPPEAAQSRPAIEITPPEHMPPTRGIVMNTPSAVPEPAVPVTSDAPADPAQPIAVATGGGCNAAGGRGAVAATLIAITLLLRALWCRASRQHRVRP